MNSRCGLVIVMMIEQARKVQLKSVCRVVMYCRKKRLQLQERPGTIRGAPVTKCLDPARNKEPGRALLTPGPVLR